MKTSSRILLVFVLCGCGGQAVGPSVHDDDATSVGDDAAFEDTHSAVEDTDSAVEGRPDPGPYCVYGNGTCEPACGESLDEAPCDCKLPGDGVCSPCENPDTSIADCCGQCGDGLCMGYGCGESSVTCPADCGSKCPSGTCDKGENPFGCPEDCKWQQCGNGVCEPSDGGPAACPADCAAACGDCTCQGGEDWLTCPVDCGYCGDHVCSGCPKLNEDATRCAFDCSAEPLAECRCLIGAVCYEEGQANPSNACQACAPDATVLAWSDVTEGTDCGAGRTCQSGQCLDVVETTCAGTKCPSVSGLLVSCNAQDVCEYTDGSGSAMLYVPAGSLWMGANMDGTQCPTNTVDGDAAPAELPCHEVTVPGFLLDRTEVTVAAYKQYYDANGGAACTNPGDGLACTPGDKTYETYCNWAAQGRDQHPVNCVTWFQADGFCRASGRRLCSEAEWELASRGTDGRKYPWASGDTDCPSSWGASCSGAEWTSGTAKASCDESLCHDGFEGTAPVGSFPGGTSPAGALDMSGNVFEWVQDWWHDTYDGAPANGLAWEAPTGSVRVLRGGGFSSVYDYSLRASYRYHDGPSNSSDSLGARCCRTP